MFILFSTKTQSEKLMIADINVFFFFFQKYVLKQYSPPRANFQNSTLGFPLI